MVDVWDVSVTAGKSGRFHWTCKDRVKRAFEEDNRKEAERAQEVSQRPIHRQAIDMCH